MKEALTISSETLSSVTVMKFVAMVAGIMRMLENFQDNELFRIKYKNQFLGIGVADCEKQQVAIKCIINYPEVSQL